MVVAAFVKYYMTRLETVQSMPKLPVSLQPWNEMVLEYHHKVATA